MRRDTQGHLVFFKGNHKQLQRDAGDFLLLNGYDLPNAMRGVDDKFIGAEIKLFRFRHVVAPVARANPQ